MPGQSFLIKKRRKNCNELNNLARFYHKNRKKIIIKISHLQYTLKVAHEITQKNGINLHSCQQKETANCRAIFPRRNKKRRNGQCRCA